MKKPRRSGQSEETGFREELTKERRAEPRRLHLYPMQIGKNEVCTEIVP